MINENIVLSADELGELCGEGYLNVLLRKLNDLINADYTFVARVINNTEAETVAFWGDNQFFPPVRYPLLGTPCEDLRCSGSVCIYSDITQSYPTDQFLKDLSICGYLGITLRDDTNKVIGILSALFKNPIEESSSNKITELFQSVAIRSSRELERIRYEHYLRSQITQLQEKNDRLNIAQRVYEFSKDGIIVTDQNNKIVYVNAALEKMSGYHLEELVGQDPSTLTEEHEDHTFYKKLWNELLETGNWQGEFNGRTKQGNIYPVSTSISVIPDDENNIKHFVSINRDISAEKEAQNLIIYQATHDFLTNLYNRYELNKQLDRRLRNLAALNRKGAFILLDIDDFKSVNDTKGHDIGDILLQMIAQRIKDCTTPDCILARLGGDEFAIFSHFDDIQRINRLIDKILTAFQTSFNFKDLSLRCNVSLGVSIFPDDADNDKHLFSCADQALFAAKKTKGNHHAFFTPELQVAVERRQKVWLRLAEALDNNKISVNYQPIVNAQSAKVTHLEVLARWHDEELGWVSPVEFINIAEQSGLIHQLGYQVAKQAIADLAVFNKLLKTPIQLSINRSAEEFNEEDSQLETLLELSAKAKISPNQIIIELTESFLMKNPELANSQLTRLKQSGFKLALDDFGTGFSSLAYLRKYPFDILKIDRSFVQDIKRGNDASVLVKSIIEMSSNLSMSSIAEGVETSAQAAILESLGCNYFQGFYFSKPLTREQCITYLENFNA